MTEDTGTRKPFSARLKEGGDPEIDALVDKAEALIRRPAIPAPPVPIMPTLGTLSDEIDALKARVTELEAALKGLADRP